MVYLIPGDTAEESVRLRRQGWGGDLMIDERFFHELLTPPGRWRSWRALTSVSSVVARLSARSGD